MAIFDLLKPRSIGQRLAFSSGGAAAVILIILSLLNYRSAREILLEHTTNEALKLMEYQMGDIDDLIERIAMIPQDIGARQSLVGPDTNAATAPYLAALLDRSPADAIYGLYMSLEAKDWKDPQGNVWVDRKSYPQRAQLAYDYHNASQDWYRGAKESGKLHVTEPYFDEGGSDVDMVSITEPVYDATGKFLGVAGADVSLDKIRDIIRSSCAVGNTLQHAQQHLPRSDHDLMLPREKANLLSSTGAIIATSEDEVDGKKAPTHPTLEKISSALVTSLPDVPLSAMQEILKRKSGWVRIQKNGKDRILYWAQGRTTGWKLVLEVPYNLIVGPARNLAFISALFAAGGLFLLMMVTYLIAQRMSDPLRNLQEAATALEKGNFREQELQTIEKRTDELGRLAHSFSAMARQIINREENLAELNATLEKTVEQRTSDLARAVEEAEGARHEAESANNTKSAFLANMSHELRTPMNAIIGYSEILIEEAEELEGPAMVPDLQKIQTAGKHLLALINDILDLSKIEAGKMTTFLEKVDISGVVKEVAQTVQPLIEKNANTFTIECPDDLGIIITDLTKLRQALFNLLSNATKFTEGGKISLNVSRSMDAKGTAMIDFAVTDSGIGMSEEQLGKLFGDFVQADANTTRKYGGTGLGLAISRRFCRMLGGDITVKSRIGHGSTFTISLPIQPPAPQAKALDPIPNDGIFTVEKPTEPAASTGSDKERVAAMITILAIDDDPTTLELMQRLLGKEGYRVLTAPSGEKGLPLARKEHPSLITLDVMMPSMDGWTVLAALKADPITADIPVIMMTMLDDKPLGIALGAIDYITKPLDKKVVSSLIRKLTGQSSGDILIVEDDPVAAELVMRELSRDGFQWRHAKNGLKALEQISRVRPALIVLDLMMPEMNGFEFLEQLHLRGEQIPVVVLTARELTAEEKTWLRGEVAQILQKGTARGEDLVATIHTHLSPH